MFLKKYLILAACCMLTLGCAAQSKPTRNVTLPTEHDLGVKVSDYVSMERGFYAAGEVAGGVSLMGGGKRNIGFTEINAVGGYRFGEYFRAGLGLAGRYYIDGFGHNWALPLYLNFRGNFIPTDYYNVVPMWSMDIGTTFPDGFMIRPTLGIRVGQKRSAFVASIGYMGQTIRTLKRTTTTKPERSFYSFITLKVGYEF